MFTPRKTQAAVGRRVRWSDTNRESEADGSDQEQHAGNPDTSHDCPNARWHQLDPPESPRLRSGTTPWHAGGTAGVPWGGAGADPDVVYRYYHASSMRRGINGIILSGQGGLPVALMTLGGRKTPVSSERSYLPTEAQTSTVELNAVRPC